MTRSQPTPDTSRRWRFLAIAAVVAGSLVVVLGMGRIPQNQAYHQFADGRPLFGIPNFGDVFSNIGFLMAGIAGLAVTFSRRLGAMQRAWFVTFAGIALVGIASAYYHWEPNDYTLVWDRMSLTVGFTGLFVALLGEYLDEALGHLLWPAVILGVGSVLYWHWTDDLRLYYWVQAVPLLTVPFLMLLFPAPYPKASAIFIGVILYGLAKLAELGDKFVFASTGEAISGHTLKHILASLGCLAIVYAVSRRERRRELAGGRW